MTKIYRLLFLAALALPAAAIWAQETQQSAPPARVVSPEVHSDGSVTFRLRDPTAKQVSVSIEGLRKPLPMRNENGVWIVTAPPMEPDLYGYSIISDGVALADPSNPLPKPNLLFPGNLVRVPGPDSLPWEIGNVPHGVVHHHHYRSEAVGDQRDFYVYTPPGYNPRAGTRYPTLYLLHGFSDDASAWVSVGRANFILDNLIAQGKVKPMLVVMPLGYGAPEILTGGFGSFRDSELVRRNFSKFGEALLGEVIPRVERAYRASPKRESRAIAGLSMGGAESLFVGLNNLDRFAWIGAFSSGGLSASGDYDQTFPSLGEKANDRLRLLWISCGAEDSLIDANRSFRDWLKSKLVRHTYLETPGMHVWMVWRRNLAAFTPLLFRGD